jgi:hypothetical protein
MFYFILLCTFFAFLLPPIVEVDISNIAIISGITNMVKAIILAITNTPQKLIVFAPYTSSSYWTVLKTFASQSLHNTKKFKKKSGDVNYEANFS